MSGCVAPAYQLIMFGQWASSLMFITPSDTATFVYWNIHTRICPRRSETPKHVVKL
ncbi:hypothetical protein BDZ94DRAFT_1246892 [Collybia nuda]|uniref:Uncharacterized protein n=1 Tax=Collybia nuda TaxID=64659 RepID=A0A9P5YHM8_9AGAR|nr:hypothetical protein BDZ94DRAFT_1246892 [Collybia nuda]